MPPKIKNIIIFVTIGLIFVLIYIFFIKEPSIDEDTTLVSSTEVNSPLVSTGTEGASPVIAEDFLALLLNVTNIKLNDSIFSDMAFSSLHDSSIILTPDGNEGRPNPFAPIGSDIIALPISMPEVNIVPMTP